MIEYILEIDKDLFIFLNGLGTKTFDWFWLMITSKISNIILYIFFKRIFIKFLNFFPNLFCLFNLLFINNKFEVFNNYYFFSY